MSEYDLKLLPREDSFDFLAKTLTNGPFGKYAQKALEQATSSPDEFRVMLKTQFQKTFPNIAFPGGAGTEKMVQSMINALQAEVGEITQPEPAPAQPDETVSEADAEANKAIEWIYKALTWRRSVTPGAMSGKRLQPFRLPDVLRKTKSWLTAQLATWLICW